MSARPELPKLPKLPWDEEDGPVFKEPWQATAFALTVRLFEQGHFSWQEWTDHLAAEIAGARLRGDPDLGDHYYDHWLNALEKIVVAKGLGTADRLSRLKDNWTAATVSTPHGQPVELKSLRQRR